MKKTHLFMLFNAFIALALLTTIAQGEETMIADGKTVQIDYTLTVDGQTVDTSEGKQPLQYTQGQGMLISGLEKKLEGMKAGDSKQVTIAPADGYGEIVQEAFKEFPKDQFPENITPEVGMPLTMTTPQGQKVPAVVSEVKDDSVILNFNHPLAGKELHFDVTVVSVQ